MTAWASRLGPALVERIGWSLVHSVWQVAVVALVAAGLLKILRRSSAQSRYLTAWGALVTMAILPLTTFGVLGIPDDSGVKPSRIVSRSAMGLMPAPALDSRANQAEDLLQKQSPAAEDAGQHGLDRNETAGPVRGSALEPVLPWLVGAWGVGIWGLSLRLLGGRLWIQWLVRRETRPVAQPWAESLARLKGRLRIDRPVRLVGSIRLQVPLAVGWIRPVILLPVTALTGFPSDQLEAILAHELAHIRRYDYVVNLVQSVIETLLFYHPAAWWISGRIRAEREHCCDDWAVDVCGDRLTYARALAAIEEQRTAGWLLAPSARDGSLLDRVRRLLGVAQPEERPTSGLAGALALAAVALLGVMFLMAPAANQARAGVEARDAITGVVVAPDGKPCIDRGHR